VGSRPLIDEDLILGSRAQPRGPGPRCSDRWACARRTALTNANGQRKANNVGLRPSTSWDPSPFPIPRAALDELLEPELAERLAVVT
jgi:hypothetical protein